ncbi:transmembrane protein, putative [Medicago truncatula]|uniref:Transmembrane protein, putative n=1 Tax=Medicago truncatula TaxID=3880 RepID=G7JJJ9_MEDTR|nr:transmembrane protein, putative [Medicago truncatula]
MASMRVAFVVAIMCMVVVSAPMAEAVTSGRGALTVERLEGGDGSLLPLLVLLALIM